jgi:hypothetical protein
MEYFLIRNYCFILPSGFDASWKNGIKNYWNILNDEEKNIIDFYNFTNYLCNLLNFLWFNTPQLAAEHWGCGGFVPLHTHRFQGEIFNTPELAPGILYFVWFFIYFYIKINYQHYSVDNFWLLFRINVIFQFFAIIDYLVITIIYIIHNLINKKIKYKKKILRMVLLIFLYVIGIQIYWYKYIYKEL